MITDPQRRQIDALKESFRQIIQQKGEAGIRLLVPPHGLDPSRYPLLHRALAELKAEGSLTPISPEDHLT